MSGMNIAALLEDAPYEESSIVAFEGHVAAQKAGSVEYDFNANKVLLKSYQCNSSINNAQVVCDILVLGLMQLPKTDFFELSFLIPSKYLPQSKAEKTEEALAFIAQVSTVTKCANLLEQAQYNEFWAELSSNEAAKNIFSFHNCQSSLRTFILNNVSNAYKNISKTLLLGLLGYTNDQNAFTTFINSNSKVVDLSQTSGDNDVINFIENASNNNNKTKKSELSLRVTDMLNIVSSIRGA